MPALRTRRVGRGGVAALALGALAVLTLSARPVAALPAGVTFSRLLPTDGSTLLVARTAANNPLDDPTFELKSELYLNNSAAIAREVTSVEISYPGSGIPTITYTPKRFVDHDADPDTPNQAQNYSLAPADESLVGIHDGLTRDLPTPLPATVQLRVWVDADPTPLVLAYSLAFRENDTSIGSHFFPGRAADLDAGEYWAWSTRHVVDSGGGVGGVINPTFGSQRYAIDMGVVAWDDDLGRYSGVYPGTDGSDNDDYRIWGKPLYATADGTVVACYRGEPDEPPGGFDEITIEYLFGNSVFIQTGTDLVGYAHMQDGSIPDSVCPDADDGSPSTGLNIPIEAGTQLGVVGNTGRSTNPHLHIQVQHVPDTPPDTQSGVPLQFVNVRTLADETDIDNLGSSPTLRPQHGSTLHRHALVLPNPCGFDIPDPGHLEVSRHGIPAACYQDTFNLIASRGYRPVFVDGYDAGGETYFNATFRPAGPASYARHGLTGAQYQDVFDDLTGDGWRLHQIDSYLQDGSVRYAAIFEVRPGPAFAAFHGLTTADYGDEVDELADDGFVPVNVSAVEAGGQVYWTGLFEQVDADGWTLQTVADAAYQDTFDDNADAGRTLFYVHGFHAGGSRYLTGIFVDPIDDATAAVHGFTSAAYQTEFDTQLAAGRLTRYTSGYDDGGGNPIFAALWRGRPNTSLTQTPAAVTNQTTATFDFEASHPFTTFECKLDDGAWQACTGPVGLAGVTEGSHTFTVRSVDREQVRDATPASFTWLVDTTGPVAAIVAPPLNTKTVHGVLKDDPVAVTTVIGWADVLADATDNLSGVASVVFEVNDVVVASAMVDADTWTFTFTPDQNGEHTYVVEVIATDGAGNSTTVSRQIVGVKTGRSR